jgi:hypothetical protein
MKVVTRIRVPLKGDPNMIGADEANVNEASIELMKKERPRLKTTRN